MKRSFSFWLRRALGAPVITGIAAIAIVRHTNMFNNFSIVNTAQAEGSLSGAFHSERSAVLTAIAAESQPALADGESLPDLGGAIAWLNSAPLGRKSLRGKVVLVNFWTYSCINSLRELPYMKSWAAKYKNAGLVVIGVHAPEFGFEKERANVENAVHDLKVTYPVAIDSNDTIWQAFSNEYWPADYFIDGKGRIRYHHFGEGEYAQSERVIQELLKENGATGLDGSRLAYRLMEPRRHPAQTCNLPKLMSAMVARLGHPSRKAKKMNETKHQPSSMEGV